MSNTIGRVDFTATLDGRRTPQEAENIGRKAGAAAGEGYDKEWSKSFRETLTKSGQRSFDAWKRAGGNDATAYGSALSTKLEGYLKTARKNFADLRLEPGFLDDFIRRYDDAGIAAGELQRQLVTLRQENEISATQFNAAKRQVDEWALSNRQAAIDTNNHADRVERLSVRMQDAASWTRDYNAAIGDLNRQEREHRESLDGIARALQDGVNESQRAAAAADKLAASQNRLTKANADQEHGWRSLSHNTRQWTLIIGAIASGMQDLSVLGSAAGAGLFALGGAATSGVAGLGALVATFVTLNKEAEDLPPSLRAAKAEFDRFTPVFSELREAVSTGALSEMGGTFDLLGQNLRSLTPELTSLGRHVGQVFDDFAEGTREGSDALEEIRRALRLAGGNFDSLAGSAGTLGTALIRSFNRAQPLVQQTLDYVDLLANRLDDFSRGTGFDDWMRNAQTTFSHLGPLLDATGRALNDLVTPESVAQTAALLDDLTGFMPVLGDILGILGSANPFGLLAQALNEAGDALEPLLPSLDRLAESLSSALSTALPAVAVVLESVANALAPVAEGAADFIDALPPDALEAIAGGLAFVAAAMVTMKGVGAAASLLGFADAAGVAKGAVTNLGTGLKSVLGKAGLAGAAVAGAFALTEAIEGLARELSNVEGQAKDFVVAGAQIDDIFRKLNSDAQGNSLVGQFEDLGNALERLPEVGSGVGGVFQNIGLAFSESGAQALALSGTLKELDAPLAEMANSSVAAATDRFAMWAEQLGATDEQVLAMLDSMPEFKSILESIAMEGDGVATSQELVSLALGETKVAADGTTTSFTGLGGAATSTRVDIDDLASSIRGFSDTVYGSRDAAREYEAAIDDLSKSIETNGTTLDINSEQGRANQEAVDRLAQSVLENSAATLENTKDQEAARGVMEQGRQKLIEMLEQFGLTEQAANDYADELGLIPEDVLTDVELEGIQQAEAEIQNLIRRRSIIITTQINNGGGGNWGGRQEPMASGGTLFGPTRILAGEAGPEAIVPLNRPLSQVDESVRWLSAIAQGKGTPAMAGGGMVGAGNQWNVAEGAIVVKESGDPRRAANEVLQRLAEQVVG